MVCRYPFRYIGPAGQVPKHQLTVDFHHFRNKTVCRRFRGRFDFQFDQTNVCNGKSLTGLCQSSLSLLTRLPGLCPLKRRAKASTTTTLNDLSFLAWPNSATIASRIVNYFCVALVLGAIK